MPAAKKPVPHERTIVGIMGFLPRKQYLRQRKRRAERAALEAAKWDPRPYSERKRARERG